MTITTTSSKVVCLGNGSTTVFAFPFLIPVSGQEQIIYTDTSGNQTTLVASQYTITGFGNPAGGTVTYPKIGAPIPSGATLTIARVLPLTQPTSISNQGAFYPSVVESSLDNATMQIQQIAQGQAQSLKGPIVDSVALGTLPAAAQRANQLLGFDSTGQPIAAQPSSAAVSSVMQPVVNASSIAQAVGLLGLPVFVGVGTTSGTANAQVVAATTPGTFARTAGNKVLFIPSLTNTSAMTLAVAGTTAANFYVPSANGPVPMEGGEVIANQITEAIFDGTRYVLETFNPNASFGSLTNLASAGTTDLGTVTSHNVNITGTTTISSFGSSASTAFPVYMLTFAGALTLTYNATSMILPGGVNIITAAGDTAVALYLGSGNWRVVSYQPAVSLPGINPTAVARKNLKIVTASITAGTITADELILENSNGAAYRAISVNVSYATGTAGANGLDAGTITASNWYFEWVIYNAATNTLASLLSLSSTAPTMPSGYTFKARVGASYFDSGSKLRFKIQYDRRAQIVVGTNPTGLPVMASGSSGSLTVPTWTAVAVGSFVPSTASAIEIVVGATSNPLSTHTMVAPNSSYGAYTSTTNPPVIVLRAGGAEAQTDTHRVSMTLESTNIYYASDMGATLGLFCAGWEDGL